MARFTTSDGLSLHYDDSGDTTSLPLLCLSGLTRNGRDFDFVAPHLPDVRLIRMDYRGRGQSDHAPDPASYSPLVEGRDALELLDHLGIRQAAILGTSRGGLIAMILAQLAHDRLLGVALNDIGPEIAPGGLEGIMAYVGNPPPQRTLAEFAAYRRDTSPDFAGVSDSRWREEAERMFDETPEGLRLRYDARLREPLLAAAQAPQPDLWPLFDALQGLPLACIRGAASDILSAATLAEMRRRRPDMIVAEVPGRGHIPFLDEPEALSALRQWIGALQ